MEKFYETKEWRELRYKILRKYPRKCMLCNAENKELHVDHIKPKSIYPELALDATNLQILCKECNLGKSNLYIDDFREKPTKPHDLSIMMCFAATTLICFEDNVKALNKQSAIITIRLNASPRIIFRFFVNVKAILES